MLVNWRCEMNRGCADPHYQQAGYLGLGAVALPLMTSSYVTPLGLARLINLRYAMHSSKAMSDALVATLRQDATPLLCGDDGAQPCVHQDPIAHRQLESDRLAVMP